MENVQGFHYIAITHEKTNGPVLKHSRPLVRPMRRTGKPLENTAVRHDMDAATPTRMFHHMLNHGRFAAPDGPCQKPDRDTWVNIGKHRPTPYGFIQNFRKIRRSSRRNIHCSDL
jgi:hypothetical protein